MTRTTLLCSLVCVLAAGPAGADAPLDLRAAWTEARSNNAAIAEAEAEVASARAEITAARPLLPNPELELDYDDDQAFNDEGERDVTVALEQELPVFGTRGAAIDEAEARLRAARSGLESAEHELLAELRTALAELAAAAEATKLREELAEAAGRLAEAARARLEAGAMSRADANLAAVEAAAAAADREEARAAEATAASRLCELLGRRTCGAVAAAWPETRAEIPSEEELVEQALAGRADLASARAATEAAESDLRQARRARIPVPTLGLSYSEERSAFEEAAALTETDRFFGFSVRIPLPIWSFGGGDVARAEAGEAAAGARLRSTRVRIPAEIRAARARLVAAQAAAASWQDVAPRIEETLRWFTEGYEARAVPIETFLLVRDRLVRAQQGALASRRELVAASAALDRALGLGAPSLLGSDTGAAR